MKQLHARAFGFDTITLEGPLFVADLLEKASRGEASRQSAADYHVPRGLRLADEYGRAFHIAQAVWKQYRVHSESLMREFFRDALGYTALSLCEKPVIGNNHYPIRCMAAHNIPLVIAPSSFGLDQNDTTFAVEGEGARKKSAFQLAQGFLNASEKCEWALVTNGKTIRLLRDSQSLVRPSYLEFDLETIMSETRYADFCALYRLLHASRTGVWELWRKEGVVQGTRVREGLSLGVTRALIELGSGFIRAEGSVNDTLRSSLESGTLTKENYFQELLRLVYRFLFLITIEERNLLTSENSNLPEREARELYEAGYSLARLRDGAVRSNAFDRYVDRTLDLLITKYLAAAISY